MNLRIVRWGFEERGPAILIDCYTLLVSKYMTSVSLMYLTVDWLTKRAVRTRAASWVHPRRFGVKVVTPFSVSTRITPAKHAGVHLLGASY